MTPPPILLAGATASGKSALALALAERLGAVIINADSQQAYGDWRILTARPTEAEEAQAPHRLYGTLPFEETLSAGDWVRRVLSLLEETRAAGRTALLVGGTGLYFRALTEGLVALPPVPLPIREALDARRADDGLGALVAELSARDPETAAGLDHANPARVLRALEVLEATGRGLAAWQRETPPPALPLSAAHAFVLDGPADWLDARIERRLATMLSAGALGEVSAARARFHDRSLPGWRALGARDLAAHLDGTIPLAQAAEAVRLATRRYAKRQRTWFRNQMPAWTRLDATAAPDRLLQTALKHLDT